MALKVRYTQPLLGEANAAGYLIAVPGASVLIRQNGVATTVYADNAGAAMTNPVPTGVPQGTAGVDTNGTLLVYLTAGNGYDGVATVGATVSTFAMYDVSPDVADVVGATTTQSAEAVVTPVFKVIPATAAAPQFEVHFNSYANSAGGAGTRNHATFFGYNVGRHSGGTVVANKAAIIMGFEDNFYDPADSTYGTEWYVEHCSPDNSETLFRPFYARMTPSNVNTPVSATIHMDIGVAGVLGVYSGLINPPLMTVQPTQVQITKNLLVTAANVTISPAAGQANLYLGSVSQQGVVFTRSGVQGWILQQATTTSFTMYDKDVRSHVTYTYGATAAAAVTQFGSQVKVDGNLSLGSAPDAGGGSVVFAVKNCTTAPASTPASGGVIYVESGALKYKGSSGSVTVLAAA